ncbi:hypothetical protein DEE91_00830 [Ralstonia pickettii]|jgi:hypothetical protein|nr:hypothetical protein [Ralstonia insidiosa]MBX3770283.1 hypothetical protein [Ralstonia pickettii]NOZ14812.1 hypothetical protein [Betaproteobacteria bacterium]MBA9854445.1 hypothetical protein [Ralstonia insidiosa]MBA9868260.1 hypothetical protein [Ralstonia insidiosa]MBA9911501.1 hypothetical protein [Ralstonia insidiosa]
MIDFDTWWNSAAADEFRAQHEDMDGNAFRPVWDAAIQAAQQQAEPVGDERKAFETWAQSKNMHLAKGNCGWYISAPTHEAWQGWQACAAQSAQSCQRAGVAEGWCFYSADFSMNASNPANWGTVMLTRDDAGRKWWHALSDEEREKIDLFVSGRGTTFDAAMKSANEKAVIAAAPTPAAQGGDGHE